MYQTDAALNLPKVTRTSLIHLGAAGLEFLEYRNYYAAVMIKGKLDQI